MIHRVTTTSERRVWRKGRETRTIVGNQDVKMREDRRISAILDRLAGASGGEAVAALTALRRLLPDGVELADVLTIGLHYMRQDVSDPSLAVEVRRLTAALRSAGKTGGRSGSAHLILGSSGAGGYHGG